MEAVALFDQLGIHRAHLVERERSLANRCWRLTFATRLEEMKVTTIALGLLVLGFLTGQLAKADEVRLVRVGEHLLRAPAVLDEDVARANLSRAIELERVRVVDRFDLFVGDLHALERLVDLLLHELLDHGVAACANDLWLVP